MTCSMVLIDRNDETCYTVKKNIIKQTNKLTMVARNLLENKYGSYILGDLLTDIPASTQKYSDS